MKRAKTLDLEKLNAAMAATDDKCMLGRSLSGVTNTGCPKPDVGRVR